ncbi:hypothetical protein [Sulfurimonas diazotrophicus]|uniref:Uncharacterized protein n=1 Tax=Sulfurimonas diazotrophicus TaxID=3131939 RepID=A0ABZ3H8X8_9BACT
MTIALFNTTPIVAKLVERLAQKRGDSLLQPGAAGGRRADVAIVDDSVAARYDAAAAKTQGHYAIFIGSRFDAMPQGYDASLGKPFLPEELARALDDAEMAVSALVERSDVFDADEAAEAWEEESAAPLFDSAEIDELKELLDAVEGEEAEEPTYGDQIEAAMEHIDRREWEQPIEEVLYDADAPERTPEETDFSDIDLHARGVEALQDLMAILSDESVAQALKAMGVRIDISFGEKA